MVCTTFLHNGELNQSTGIPEMNKLLKEVREKTGQDWQIIPRYYDLEQSPLLFFRKRKTVKFFELYCYVGGVGPWQIINFYRDRDWSINTRNSAELVMAYLYGILAGIHAKELQNDKG